MGSECIRSPPIVYINASTKYYCTHDRQASQFYTLHGIILRHCVLGVTGKV